MQKNGPFDFPIKIDVGEADEFLINKQLLPEAFEKACISKNQK